jgi:cyanophycinase
MNSPARLSAVPLALAVICFLGAIANALHAAEVPSVGPKKGALVICGGGTTTPILRRFLELAGGKDAPLVIIPTANGPDASYATRLFKDLGATDITILHTTDPKVANSDDFVKPLLTAKALWWGGGRQWRLVDAYQGTKVEKLAWGILDRGGVIGGDSAGATIQGSYLARGDTKNNQIMTGDHEVGFGYLKNTAIDQHQLVRNRHFDMFTIKKKYPNLLGIGLDERTAIIVQGDSFSVMGNGYVSIYDGTFWSREGTTLKILPEKESLFYFLRPGDRYDLKARKVIPNKRR